MTYTTQNTPLGRNKRPMNWNTYEGLCICGLYTASGASVTAAFAELCGLPTTIPAIIALTALAASAVAGVATVVAFRREHIDKPASPGPF